MQSLYPTRKCHWSPNQIIPFGKACEMLCRGKCLSQGLLCSLSKIILIHIYIILDNSYFCPLARCLSRGHRIGVSACPLHRGSVPVQSYQPLALPVLTKPLPTFLQLSRNPAAAWALRRQWKRVPPILGFFFILFTCAHKKENTVQITS